MADTTKVPVKTEKALASMPQRPFESLRREVDRLFEDFGWRHLALAIRPLVLRYWARLASPIGNGRDAGC